MHHFALLIFSCVLSLATFAQKVTIHLNGIRNSNGQIQLAVFETEKQFKDEKPAKFVYYDKTGIKDGKKTITLDLPAGTYGLSFLNDEDKSKKMTFRMGIYPKEGVGFSNFYLKGMSKPKFSDFNFELKDQKTVNVTFRYF